MFDKQAEYKVFENKRGESKEIQVFNQITKKDFKIFALVTEAINEYLSISFIFCKKYMFILI